MVDVGQACQRFHNDTVVNIQSKRVQCDEIWSFVYAKEKNKPDNMEGVGDVWTWTALDADTKLIVSWTVADRSPQAAKEFMQDVAGRLKNRVQLTTDGLKAYLDAVYGAFDYDIDYAQLVKMYGTEGGSSSGKYSPQNTSAAKRNGYPAIQIQHIYLHAM